MKGELQHVQKNADKYRQLQQHQKRVDAAIAEKDYLKAIQHQSLCVALFPNYRNYVDRAELYEAAGHLQAAYDDLTIAYARWATTHVQEKLAEIEKVLGDRLLRIESRT